MNIAKLLRTTFFIEHLLWLPLFFMGILATIPTNVTQYV